MNHQASPDGVTKKAHTKTRKLLLLGFQHVGKSSLCIQYVDGQFVESYGPTIENTFNKMQKHKGQEYLITAVDTAGQDEYSLFTQYYNISVHGYILVYSITSRKSFEVLKVIHDKLLDMTGSLAVPIIVVGNKTDLHVDRAVSYEEGKALADKWKAAFLEVSAKKNESVADIFKVALQQIDKISGGDEKKKECSVM